MKNSSDSQQKHKPRPLMDLLISIAIPSVILMKFSEDTDLGATNALLIALSLPLGWGLFELIKYKKFNFVALLGLVSILLTGGISLLQLETQWLAVKEAAIPAVIGLAVLISTKTPYPLFNVLLFNPNVFAVDIIKQRLDESDNEQAFNNRLLTATYLFSSTFFFSAAMNYGLTKWIVTSPTGSIAFNEELGRLTLLSYPMIAIPSMVMTLAIFYYLWRSINGMTGLSLEEIMVEKNH